MIQEIVDQIAEEMVKGQAEYVSIQLERTGYSREYVKAHKYDFITVRINIEPTEEMDGLAYVVHVPTGTILFGFTRHFRQVHGDSSNKYGIQFTFELENPLDAPSEVWEEIRKCAEQARIQALAMLK